MSDWVTVEPSDSLDWSEDPKALPVVGFAVQIIEFPIRIWAYGDGPRRIEVFLSGRFVFGRPDGEDLDLNAEADAWERLAVLLVLRDDIIVSATVSSDSHLRLDFESGRYLVASPDHQYESWEVVGPGFFIVGTPGEPTAWSGPAWAQD